LPAESAEIIACGAKKSAGQVATVQGGCCSAVSMNVVVHEAPELVDRSTASLTWPVDVWFLALSEK